MSKRDEAASFLAGLAQSSRMRESTLDAILAMRDAEEGTLVLRLPRASGKPIDGSVIMGGLQLRLFEDREIA